MDVDRWLSKLWQGQILRASEVKRLCSAVKEVFCNEENVVGVDCPVTVVGDVHGQLDDVLEMFRVAGVPPDTNFLFLGDFVDRGAHSVETISLIFCLKLRFPHRIHLIRGNHESRHISQVYGFYNECAQKYNTAQTNNGTQTSTETGTGMAVWSAFTDTFDALPLAATVQSRLFAVHGGLSPCVASLDQLRTLMRFREIPPEGAIADLMWSDPDTTVSGFAASSRGAGYLFGADITRAFCHFNGLVHVMRAHQLCMEGYQILFDNLLSTVWSAPNYVYKCGNLASVLEISDTLEFSFNVFEAAPAQDRLAANSNFPTIANESEAHNSNKVADKNMYFT